MTTTAFGALSLAQKKVWAMEISIQGRDQNFWMSNGFVGKNTADMSRPVHKITELTPTERGDVAVMQLVAELEGDGVAGDNILEGNEEALYNDAIEIRIDQLRHGVRSKGRMAEQKTVLRFRSLAKDKLSFWLADIIDELMFLTAAGRSYTFNTDGTTRGASQLPSLAFAADVAAATSGRIFYADDATSESDLTAADCMSWNLIVNVAAYAKRKRIKPIRAGGKPYYAMVMSNEQMRDLKTDNTYQTLVSRAGPRNSDNPLFNNAVAVVDGVILYEHQKIFNTLGAASTSKWGSGGLVDGAQAIFMGAQALGLATIGNASYEESDNTDYKNRPGISYGRIFGLLKPQFKSRYDAYTRQDFGIISVKTAAAATSRPAPTP
jgi:N4-gp56 family major capsid protein